MTIEKTMLDLVCSFTILQVEVAGGYKMFAK